MRTPGFEVAMGREKKGRMSPCVCACAGVCEGKESALILFK